MIWIYIAVLASLLTAVQLIPEVIDAFKARTLKDISLSSFSIITFASFLWILHGMHNKDYALMFANVVIFICAFTIVLLKLKKK